MNKHDLLIIKLNNLFADVSKGEYKVSSPPQPTDIDITLFDCIQELKDFVDNYESIRYEMMESHGRIDFAVSTINRNEYVDPKEIEEILCGRLRSPEYSFDFDRYKAKEFRKRKKLRRAKND